MIKSGAKVTVDQTEDGEVIKILPETASWQKTALGIWLVVWVMCGLLALTGTLKEAGDDQWTFMLVFMGFWAYFLFYGIRSLIWNRSGAEFIRLTDQTLDYKRSWSDVGKVKSYDLETIKEVALVDYSSKAFAKSYNEVFWTIGGEKIGFTYIGQKIAFGFKLNAQQAKDIIKRIETARRKAANAKG